MFGGDLNSHTVWKFYPLGWRAEASHTKQPRRKEHLFVTLFSCFTLRLLGALSSCPTLKNKVKGFFHMRCLLTLTIDYWLWINTPNLNFEHMWSGAIWFVALKTRIASFLLSKSFRQKDFPSQEHFWTFFELFFKALYKAARNIRFFLTVSCFTTLYLYVVSSVRISKMIFGTLFIRHLSFISLTL